MCLGKKQCPQASRFYLVDLLGFYFPLCGISKLVLSKQKHDSPTTDFSFCSSSKKQRVHADLKAKLLLRKTALKAKEDGVTHE